MGKVFHFLKSGKTLKNQVIHKVIHIIHMEKHVDELIYIMRRETNVLVIVMKIDFSTKIGKKVLRKSGIRALSEIGAHGFACTYMERRLGKTWNR